MKKFKTITFIILQFSLFVYPQVTTNPNWKTKYAVKDLDGLINGNKKIQMTLANIGRNLSGTYFFNNSLDVYKVKGTLTEEGKFSLTEFDSSGNTAGEFTGKFISKGMLKGMWTDKRRKKSFPFVITEKQVYISPLDSMLILPKHLSLSSRNGNCRTVITYPQIRGLADLNLQEQINATLRQQFAALPEEFESKNCEKNYNYEAKYISRYNKVPIVSLQLDFTEKLNDSLLADGYFGFNINLIDGKFLTLTDMTKPNALQEISRIITDMIRKKFAVESIQEAGFLVDSVELTDQQDFYITDHSLVIQFDPGEVADTALGSVDIELPLLEIKSLLNPNIPISIFLNGMH